MSAGSSPLTPAQVFAGLVAGGYVDVDGTLAADSDSKIASQKATKTYADAGDGGGGGGGTLDKCSVYASSTQSTSNSVSKVLDFDTELYDSNTLHDTSTNKDRITIATTGYYQVGANVQFAPNGVGQRLMDIVKNGSTTVATVVQSFVSGGGPAMLCISTQLSLSATDYITCRVSQTSGGTLNVSDGASSGPMFYVHQLS